MNLLNRSMQDLIRELDVTTDGLTTEQAVQRRKKYGLNTLRPHEISGGLAAIARLFGNPLVLILLGSALVSYYLGETRGAVIISVLVLFSVLLQFFHEHRSGHAAAALRQRVAVHATVVRDGRRNDVPLIEVVPGDIILLAAGDIIPGDARLISTKDLYVNQSMLTGEAFPVEKIATISEQTADALTGMNYAVFMGCSVTSGMGTALVVGTGNHTEFGHIAENIDVRPPETEFERGIQKFSLLLMRIIFLLVMSIFFINALMKHNLFESFLFAVAVSVGLTPELLPMILTVNLANGAVAMAKKGVIVKWLASIQNFGSMDVLCSDKTGTLTEGDLKLIACTGPDGQPDDGILLYAYLNSSLQSGLRSPLDDAVLSRGKPEAAAQYSKLDEIPFDFVRRMMTVIVKGPDSPLLITKGAPESVLANCTLYRQGNDTFPLSEVERQTILEKFAAYSNEGQKVIALASKPAAPEKSVFDVDDETELTFIGFLVFFDPPRAEVADVIADLKQLGVNIKVLTGDNELIARKVCLEVGISVERILTGDDIYRMTDETLAAQAEQTAVFARLTPAQKSHLIRVLQHNGHVVGYMGDGINDAPSLHAADVGISVNNAVDVAKESAAIILLEKSLSALRDGVTEGRRTFANTAKYIMMGTSSNFGNMFSMSIASIMVPFLPMLPVQILLNNLLYDLSQIAIPMDNVDPAYIQRPRRWNMAFIRRFMLVFGPFSSLFDVLTFTVLLYGFGAGEAQFQTGWFIESLATQILVIHVIRTRQSILVSRASRWLVLSTLSAVAAGFLIPYTALGEFFGFTPLPVGYLMAIAGLAAGYLFLTELLKRWFYNSCGFHAPVRSRRNR